MLVCWCLWAGVAGRVWFRGTCMLLLVLGCMIILCNASAGGFGVYC